MNDIAISSFMLVAGTGLFLYQMDIESSSGRWMMWEITSLMIQDEPVIGVGHGNYAKAYLNYQAEYLENPSNAEFLGKAANLKQAHNEFLQSFAEGGVMSFVLLLLIWGLPFVWIFRVLKDTGLEDHTLFVHLGIHCSIFVHSLVDSPLHVLPVAVIGYANIGFMDKKVLHLNFYGIRKLLLLIALIVVYLFIGVWKVGKYKGNHYWRDGTEHIGHNEWEASLKDLIRAEKHLPEQGELLYRLGASYIFDGQYSRGLFYTGQAKKHFNDRNIYLTEAYALMRLQDFEQAKEKALRTLEMFPTHLAPHLLLGEIYYYLGDFALSKAALQKCIDEEIDIKSVETKQISEDAEKLWEELYGFYSE